MITISFFAAIRERVGISSIQLELNQVSTAGQLFESLIETYPALEDFQNAVLISVNDHYASWDKSIEEGDSVAFFSTC